jgi:hypothetical protein
LKPNVKLRSNVYIRRNPDIRKDVNFQSQIRGRDALSRLIAKISPGTSEFTAARYLSFHQRVQYCIELRCAHCGSIPEGPVRQNGSVFYDFRCPEGQCKIRPIVVRQVDLDRRVAQKCVNLFGPDIDATIRRALDRPIPDPLIPLEDGFIAHSCIIKLNRQQGHIFQSHTLPELSLVINTALANLLQEEESV